MKIRIQNFGPIHDFEFDLEKDFHVIYGKNNIGKSYAISVVYLVLKQLFLKNKATTTVALSMFILDYNLNLSINKTKELKEGEKIEITKVFNKILTDFINNQVLIKFNFSLKNTFPMKNYLRNKFNNGRCQISISANAFILDLTLEEKTGSFIVNNLNSNKKYYFQIVTGSDKIRYKEYISNLSINKKDEVLIPILDESYLDTDSNIDVYLIHALSNELSKIFSQKLKNTYGNAFFLPASRSGLYEGIGSLSAVFARVSQFRHLSSEKVEIPSFSEPVSDYFLNLSAIKKNSNTDIYHKYAQEIEQKILGATIQFNDDSKKLEYYNPENGLRLDLSATSSMVSEIAPIVAYLKFIVNEATNEKERKSKILFIEEPEAHLHPEVQLMLMDIFAKLAKDKVKIVMTTHSNYIFNKVNNLLLTGGLDKDKVANYHMIHTEKGSIVVGSTDVSEEGIEDNNFINVTEKLYEERMQAFEMN